MFIRHALRRVLGKAEPNEPEDQRFVERRGEDRQPIFRECMLRLEDFYNIRAIITDIAAHGARIEFATRRDLPCRLVIIEPSLNLKCWARVVWQNDGSAGVEFQEDA